MRGVPSAVDCRRAVSSHRSREHMQTAGGQNPGVGGLGEILELLHDAGQRACPARLTVVEWTHRPRSAAAFDRFMAERHGGRVTADSAGLGKGSTFMVRLPR